MERDFINAYKKRFFAEHPDAFFYKIPDGWAEDKKGNRYGSERPFDVIAISNGVAYAKEFKFQRGGVTFNISKAVKPHQLNGLIEASKAGAHASVVLGWRPSLAVARKYNLSSAKLIVFEWNIETVLHRLSNGIGLIDELVS